MYLVRFWSPDELRAGSSEECIGLYSHDPLENPYKNIAEFCAAASEFGAWIDYDSETITTFAPDIFVHQLTLSFERVFDTVRIVPSKKAHSLNCMIGEPDHCWFVWAEPEERFIGSEPVKLDRYFVWVWFSTA